MVSEEIYFKCPNCQTIYDFTQFHELEHISLNLLPDDSGVSGHARCRNCSKDFYYNLLSDGYPIVLNNDPSIDVVPRDIPYIIELSGEQPVPAVVSESGGNDQGDPKRDKHDKMAQFEEALNNIDEKLSLPALNKKISEALDIIIMESPPQIEAGFALLKNKFHLISREIEAFRKELNHKREQIDRDETIKEINAVFSKISKPTKKLSEDEKQEAIDYLKRPDLFKNISRDIVIAGEVVGEETNKMMLYLAATSRKFKNPISLVIFGKSSSGKSYLANAVEQFMPEEDTLVLSSVSAKALEYAGDQLKHKCILVQEWEGLKEVLPTLRTLQSEGKLARFVTIRDPITNAHIAVANYQDCPCSVIVTTTKEGIHDENSTRIFELYADESLEQTKNVVGHTLIRADMTKRISEEKKRRILELHRNVQRVLEPVEVNVPFAEHLSFPAKTTRHRRDSDRFVNLIKAVAFLRQKQKEPETMKGAEYISADMNDYQLAYNIGLDVIRGTLNPISDRAKNAMMVCCELNERLVEAGKDPWFSVTDIQDTAPDLDLDLRNRQDLYKQLDKLEEYEYIERKQDRKNSTKYYKVCFAYERNEAGEIINIDVPDFKEILTPGQLQDRLQNQRIVPPEPSSSETENDVIIQETIKEVKEGIDEMREKEKTGLSKEEEPKDKEEDNGKTSVFGRGFEGYDGG
ncbi:MAG: hypothetical protein JRJ70_08560 [Deltaproteobacteria bacterium]|nr:hypothetical protein [Deltaproteobacteria bacterium]